MRSCGCSFALLLALGCSGPPSGLAPEPDTGAPSPDAAPPDASIQLLGPSLVFDDLHIAGTSEDAHALSLMGSLLNPQLETALADGTLLLGIELRGLDDPRGQDDPEVEVGLFTLTDTDGDPTDNFTVGSPETFTVAAGGFLGDDPTALFDNAGIAGGVLSADGIAALELLGDILPIALQSVELSGELVPNPQGTRIDELLNGRLRTGLPASLFALLPNIAGDMCGGTTMLDVIATGCGLVPLAPDLDLDGDGLESFSDTDDDGSIDRCVDGDGTVFLGTDCTSNPAMADGYRLIFVVHGVRALIARE